MGSPSTGWRNRRARILSGSIWDPHLLEEVPPRFRGLYTAALPAQYALLMAFGILGAFNPFRSVTLVTSLQYAELWTLALAGVALLALAGLVLRREQLELYAAIALAVGFATYPIATIVLASGGLPEFLPFTVGLWSFLIIPLWRIRDLVRVIRLRRERPTDA